MEAAADGTENNGDSITMGAQSVRIQHALNTHSVASTSSTLVVQQPMEEPVARIQPAVNNPTDSPMRNVPAPHERPIRAPSMKALGKRTVQSPMRMDDLMDTDPPQSLNSIQPSHSVQPPHSIQPSNSIQPSSSTATTTIKPPQRRIRVGLSKRTANNLHNDVHIPDNDTPFIPPPDTTASPR